MAEVYIRAAEQVVIQSDRVVGQNHHPVGDWNSTSSAWAIFELNLRASYEIGFKGIKDLFCSVRMSKAASTLVLVSARVTSSKQVTKAPAQNLASSF